MNRWHTIVGLLRRAALVTLGAVLVLGCFGLFIGGWQGALGGAMWGAMAGVLSIPAILTAMVLSSGDDVFTKEQRDDWAERTFGP